jgi:hypothetical protein
VGNEKTTRKTITLNEMLIKTIAIPVYTPAKFELKGTKR